MDWKDARTPYLTGEDIRIIDLDGQMIRKPKGFFATVRNSDVVIDIGAGDSFADIYGTRRLKRMFMLKYLTHMSGTPLVMAPQTIGPFTKVWSKAAARISMRRCAIVASRDHMSTKAAHALGRKDVIEASDVALRLPYDAPPPRAAGGPVKVGINVSGLLMGGGYTGKNEFGLKMDYPGLVRSLIEHFQAHPGTGEGCEVHLVPHVIVRSGPMVMEDDARASAALTEAFPGTVLAPAFESPQEAKSYIAGLDFFMGARMHACIAAFSSGVPVVPMAYSRKFEGLFGSIGFGRTVDCTTESAEAILAKITAAFEDRDALKAEAETALKRGLFKLALYEDALRTLLSRI